MTLHPTKMPERHCHADDGADRSGHGESSFSGQIFHQREEMFHAKEMVGVAIIDIVMYDDAWTLMSTGGPAPWSLIIILND